MNGKHISDELPRLLTGDATHDVVMEAAEHLRTCPDCQQELVSSVVAHASLTSAHRFAPEVVSPVSSRESTSSSTALSPVIRIHGAADTQDATVDNTAIDNAAGDTAAGEDAAGEADDDASDELPDGPLPDMSRMFSQVRAEAAQAKTAPSRGQRNRRGLLAVAAAAVVLIGGGVGAGYALDNAGSGSAHTFALERFGEGHASGKATINGDSISLDAAALPRLTASQRYEVWLTNAARTHMYAIGFLGDGSSATFKVKQSYLDEFSNIEVSKQPAGKTSYSHVSVLRGAYTI